MKNELVSILSDLIALPSPYPPGTSVEICAYAARRLKKAGYKVETATHKKGVDNVVARMKGKAPGKAGRGPVIAFNAHVDTVGVGERTNWKSDPYKALVKGGLVYGLGAGNCKGSMAVQIWLAEEIARRGGPAKGELIVSWAMPIRPDVVATVIYEGAGAARARAVVNYHTSPQVAPQATLRGLPSGQALCLSAAHVVSLGDVITNAVSRPVCAVPR